MKDNYYPIQEDLRSAYYNTDYSFIADSKEIIIQIDGTNKDLFSFLEKEQITKWAYITAWNPYSVSMPAAFNETQQQRMLEKLKGYDKCKGEGKGRNSNWPGEESYFIAGITRETACEIGRQFGQNAILVSDENNKPKLEILFSGRRIEIVDGKLIAEGIV